MTLDECYEPLLPTHGSDNLNESMNRCSKQSIGNPTSQCTQWNKVKVSKNFMHMQ